MHEHVYDTVRWLTVRQMGFCNDCRLTNSLEIPAEPQETPSLLVLIVADQREMPLAQQWSEVGRAWTAHGCCENPWMYRTGPLLWRVRQDD